MIYLHFFSEFPETERTLADIVDAYRRFGYRAADLDPLRLCDNSRYLFKSISILSISRNRESLKNLLKTLRKTDEPVFHQGFNGSAQEFVDHLDSLYCERIGLEFMHLHVSFNWIKEKFVSETRRKRLVG